MVIWLLFKLNGLKQNQFFIRLKKIKASWKNLQRKWSICLQISTNEVQCPYWLISQSVFKTSLVKHEYGIVKFLKMSCYWATVLMSLVCPYCKILLFILCRFYFYIVENLCEFGSLSPTSNTLESKAIFWRKTQVKVLWYNLWRC